MQGELRGYFNDLRAKTAWSGPVDDRGLPLNRVPGGALVYFPTTLFQKALGHWDRWLEEDDRYNHHAEAFFRLANWAVEAQDVNGGWKVWPLLGKELLSPYSAMTQGEGISVLVRAYIVSKDRTYVDAARRALQPLLVIVQRGGTRRVVAGGSILEEVPSDRLSGVLNGWIFAMFGLHDLIVVEKNPAATLLLEESLQTLVTYMPQYNAGYWSYYDLLGNLASTFYQRLHIAQLAALEIAFPKYANAFLKYRRTFSCQYGSLANRLRAITVKIYQRLKNPPEVVLR